MARQEFVKDDYFKIDCECHLSGEKEYINYYPGVQKWWKGVDNVRGAFGARERRAVSNISAHREEQKVPEEDKLMEYMDRYGVDVACLLREGMMDTTGYATSWSTNGYIAAQCEKHPDRFVLQGNVCPIIQRGLDNAIWELEYLVKERNCKLIKYYPPEDTYINDERLWPFYKKVEELGVILTIHTGYVWVPPGQAKYCLPIQVDEVASKFWDMKIIAFHAGWPYNHDLNLTAATHPNVYISLSLIMAWWFNAPYRLAHIIGEAIQFAGEDHIIWGTDFFGAGGLIRNGIVAMREFEMPEELQKQYGYSPVTDEVKSMIFGENLAKLLDIDTSKRRVK